MRSDCRTHKSLTVLIGDSCRAVGEVLSKKTQQREERLRAKQKQTEKIKYIFVFVCTVHKSPTVFYFTSSYMIFISGFSQSSQLDLSASVVCFQINCGI